jgi:UPF0755 protein
MAKKKKSFLKKFLIAFLTLIIIGGGITAYKAYTVIYQPNVTLSGKQTDYLYIPTGSKFQEVSRLLYEKGFIINRNSFEWLAEYKGYKDKVKPGKYLLKADMNNNDLINILRAGKQEPVKLVFNNIRTKFQLAGKISKQLEADSVSILKCIEDKELMEKNGFTCDNAMAMFVPNTYEIFWNTSAEQFIDRMAKEYKTFWNSSRVEKAKKAGLKPWEVSVIASIIQEETNKSDEMSRIAGVYINRIHKGMLLQADPTVKFAIGDFTIKRVLNKHLEFDSHYNTYKYKGVPPGPICLASSKTIDKVLDYEKHDYIYFCAKEDFSGYHNFAKTAAEHSRNAKRYQNELNKRKIK